MRFTQYLRGSVVINNKKERIGIVKDLVVNTKSKFPRTTFLVVHLDKMEFIGGIELIEPAKNVKMLIPWEQVGSFKDYKDKKIKLKVSFKQIETRGLGPNELVVGENILDQQIITSKGIGLCRVSDVIFVEKNNHLVLIGLCVGASGLIEQLGFEWPAKIMSKVLLKDYKEEIIPWNYIKEFLPHKQQIMLSSKDYSKIVSQIISDYEDDEAIKLIHHKKQK